MATLNRPAVAPTEIELHQHRYEGAELDTVHKLSPTVLMRQSRWHGRFLELHNEMAYHRWHTTKMIGRAQLAMLISGVVGLGALAVRATTSYAPFALKAELLRAYPDQRILLQLTRIAAAILPMLLSLALFFKPVRRTIEARRIFQPLVCVVLAVAVSIESIPKTWLAIWSTEQARNQDEGAGLAFAVEHECSSTLNARSVYWHGTVLDFACALGSGMMGLRPEFVVVLVLYTVALQHAELEALWSHSLVQRGSDNDQQLVPYATRLVPIGMALMLSVVMDANERKTFVAKTLLQLAHTEHIEQLKRDKDRYVSTTTLRSCHFYLCDTYHTQSACIHYRLGWDIHLIEHARPADTVAPYAMRNNETASAASCGKDRHASTSISSCDGVAATHHRDDACPPRPASPAAASPAAPALAPAATVATAATEARRPHFACASTPRHAAAARTPPGFAPESRSPMPSSTGGDSASTDYEIIRIMADECEPTESTGHTRASQRVPRP